MFDKKGIGRYVGGDSGKHCLMGLENIEQKHSSINIDAEFLKDECASLLSKLKEENSDEDNLSHLKKYIHFKRCINFIDWFLKQPQRQGKDKLYNEKTVKAAAEHLHKGLRSLSVGTYKGIDCFSITSASEFQKVYDSCYSIAKQYDEKNRHRDFRNGLDFYLNYLLGKDDTTDDETLANIKDIISSYKSDFDRVNDDERYKWEAIGHYKKHWDIDAPDFAKMVADAFSKAFNLLASGMYFPYKMLCDYAKWDPEAARKLFKELYDENIPFEQRFKDFREDFDRYIDYRKKSEPKREKKLSHHQDLHAISVYLTFEYPETYCVYKASVYNDFKNLVGFIEHRDKSKAEVWKIENCNRMCYEVWNVVKQDGELMEMSNARLTEECYKDEDGHLLAMDVVYFGSQLAKNTEDTYWPSLEGYNPNISKEMWGDALKDPQVTTKNNLAMFKMMLELGGESTCANLSEVYGNTPNHYEMLGSGFGKRVKNKFNSPDCMDNGQVKYYPIPFTIKSLVEKGKERYSWKLRDQLKQALEEIDMDNISIIKPDGTATDIAKNTILYGPPGTGKTYSAVIYAVAIIENRELKSVQGEPYEEVLNRYNLYKSEKLIESTTFHQSYGYEEFIEGIKPVLESDNDENKDIQYEITPGLFKNFCDRAIKPVMKKETDIGLNNSPTIWKVSSDGTYENPTRTECLNNGHIRIGWDKYGPEIEEETDFFEGGKAILNAFIYKMKIGDIVLSCYSNTTIDAVGVVTGDYEWHDEYDRLKRLRKVNWIVKNIREEITEINNGTTMTLSSVYRLSISLADVMGIINKYADSANKMEPNKSNYVFIIDEINRGNISKIFGELITLIEDSKRIGQTEAVSLKLPYSQKNFGVPDNVYLIGTMNTADRSIATIDTALRRRFQFKEMQPDPMVLEGINVEGIYINDMLVRMNKRISVLYDREHTIGHAYFTPLRETPTKEALADIFANKIIPLLQEYFYEDYEKIRLVLGDNKTGNLEEQFIVAVNNDYEDLFGSTDFDFEQSTIYEINYAALDRIETYRSI